MAKDISEKDIVIMGGQSVIRVITETGVTLLRSRENLVISLFLNDDYIDFLLDYGENEKFILPPENPDQKDSTDYYVLSTEEAQKEYLEFCRSIIYGST